MLIVSCTNSLDTKPMTEIMFNRSCRLGLALIKSSLISILSESLKRNKYMTNTPEKLQMNEKNVLLVCINWQFAKMLSYQFKRL